MKRFLCICLMVSVLLVGAGCGANSKSSDESVSEAKGDVVNLEFMSNASDSTLDAYKKVAEKFNQENPDIIVNVTSQGKNYESIMKANMASNQLPDIFATHGWSVKRYSEYLRPLNDQPWADKIVDSMIPVISNEQDEIFVFPIDIDQTGILVNMTVMNKLELDPYEVSTWDDFLRLCENVKSEGIVPIGMWGKDPRTFSQYLDEMANAFYVTSPTHNYAEELQNGTFDWKLWGEISQSLVDLHEKGYLNKDVLTADAEAVQQEIAKENIAFIFGSASMVTAVKDYNPDIKLGFIPIPAVYKDDQRQLVGGEREAIGVWKDGKHKEEALKFIEFMARAENVALVCEARGNAPATKDVTVDLGPLTDDYKRYAEEGVAIYPYFDRVMLPNGMWSTMQTVGAGLISGDMTPTEASKVMEEDYNRLRDSK